MRVFRKYPCPVIVQGARPAAKKKNVRSFKFLFSDSHSTPDSKVIRMARMVHCIKLDKEAEGLDFPPYPGELGKRLWENVSKEAWAQWMKQQTMLVNENRLNLADQRARQYLARQMENHFFGGGADAVAGYVPPAA